MNPHTCYDVELIFLKKHRMKRPDERLTIYFNDMEDLHKMRKEFGKDKIDITRHYAGRITVGIFIQNWEFKHELRRKNKFDHEVKEAEKRAIIYASDSKLDANYNYKDSPPSPSENLSKVSKAPKDPMDSSSSNSSKKRRLKENEEKERRQKKKKEKEEKEKKRGKKDGLIKADKNNTMESKEQTSKASVSRETTKEGPKTKK
uniref:Uncharacterized protein n=1 Tax=Panagrolaimus superbus TaxID=310955 RepID=A0A914Y152_9BILA